METFKLELTKEEVNIVGNALLELPAKVSMKLINNINSQLSKQLQEAEPTPQATIKKQ